MRVSTFVRIWLVLCLGAVSAAACGGSEPVAPAVATPSVTFSRTRAALGSPVDVTYRFQVAADAQAFTQDYKVFVHFLDADEERMWTDDHDPPVPTTQWKPGQVIEYTRTLFIPVYPYVGDATVRLGLYSARDQSRLTLGGKDMGQAAYEVATLTLLPHSENVFLLFKDGWHQAEVATDNATVGWQWSKKVATLSFRNPRKDSTFYLHFDNPSTFAEAQTVVVKVNGTPVETLQVTPRVEQLQRLQLSSAQLGTADMVDITLDVDKTWVPALVPSANSRDPRELGIRVFHAFVEPRG
jgi:hypothetical protein